VSAVSVLWIEIWKWNKRKITHNPTKYKDHEKPIVSVDWLHEHLQDPELIILDAILETPIEDIQIKELEPLTSKPSLAILIVRCPILYQTRAFATACRKIGIHNGSKIVVYDTKGIYSSPRAWWLWSWDMRRFGVLDGGLPAWIKEGYATEKETGTIV
jgi:thiosulfate/3-mercaptopyruvate sulfurtransferase